MKKKIASSNSKGRIHSFESFGTLDGPGIRFVVFLEGCPLRCLYCHNVDMLDMKDNKVLHPAMRDSALKELTSEQLLKKILPYKHYFQSSNGGVTLSGGDPILQPNFVTKFLTLCKKEGIHTTIDTSCFTTQEILDKLIPLTDLWMISLKHFNEKKHLKLTGQSNKQILENIKYLSKKKAKIRFRYVILPGWTDTWLNLRALKKFLKTVKFQEIELLPYHTYGIYKWEKLGLNYKLKGVKPPTESSIQKIKKMLEKEGYKVLVNEV